MAPKTRYADSPLVSLPDSLDLGFQRSIVPTLDILALVLEQMALINARLDAQSADAACAAAAAADSLVAQRRRAAALEPSRDELPVDHLPPHSTLHPTAVPRDPLLGYARPDAETAVAAAAAASLIGDIPVAHCRHDAHSEPSPHEMPVEQLPPPPP
jgi:hypothetical protein